MGKQDSNTELEDIALAKACLAGDGKAQHILFNRYSGQMMALCLRYAGDHDEAQDLLQEGFVKVFHKLDMYNGKGPLGAWIRRTIANNALDHLRRNKREMAHMINLKVEAEFENVEEQFEIDGDENALNEDKLMDLVQQMPLGYRTIFNMYAVEEYTHKEIAEELGITESTSKTQYRKAKAFMRKLIEAEQKKELSE
jgi:RNA polymerase sigma-70 factor (ECF subfamily)